MDFDKLSFENAPIIKVQPPGPESKKYLDFQSLHESSAVSYPRGMPMAIHRAKGATLEDVDGNRYIDFFGGAGVMNVGHSNPDVLQAEDEAQVRRHLHEAVTFCREHTDSRHGGQPANKISLIS